MKNIETVTLRYDGAVYTGQVMKHGFGTEVDRFGNRYEGQWSTDERSGQGKMTFIDGTTYEGSWKAGKFHGIGTLVVGSSSMNALSQSQTTLSKSKGSSPDEGKEGEEVSIFKAQQESEKFIESQNQAFALLTGALNISKVSSFQGQFESGVANGIATITFAASATGSDNNTVAGSPTTYEKFEGMVKAGKMHGIGKVTYKDGTEREGTWVENQLQETQ